VGLCTAEVVLECWQLLVGIVVEVLVLQKNYRTLVPVLSWVTVAVVTVVAVKHAAILLRFVSASSASPSLQCPVAK